MKEEEQERRIGSSPVPVPASASEPERDPWRDTFLRYLGYSNEVGEAFRPLVSRSVVIGSYLVAFTYVGVSKLDRLD